MSKLLVSRFVLAKPVELKTRGRKRRLSTYVPLRNDSLVLEDDTASAGTLNRIADQWTHVEVFARLSKDAGATATLSRHGNASAEQHKVAPAQVSGTRLVQSP
jgi:hypothetical protein